MGDELPQYGWSAVCGSLEIGPGEAWSCGDWPGLAGAQGKRALCAPGGEPGKGSRHWSFSNFGFWSRVENTFECLSYAEKVRENGGKRIFEISKFRVSKKRKSSQFRESFVASRSSLECVREGGPASARDQRLEDDFRRLRTTVAAPDLALTRRATVAGGEVRELRWF